MHCNAQYYKCQIVDELTRLDQVYLESDEQILHVLLLNLHRSKNKDYLSFRVPKKRQISSIQISRLNKSQFIQQVWFDKDIFKGIDDDECLEDADVEAAISAIKKKGGKILEKQNGHSGKKVGETESGYTSDESDEDEPEKEGDDESSASDSDYDIQQMNKNAKGNFLF